MTNRNSIIKLNIKSHGYSFVWDRPAPTIDDEHVEDSWPRTVDDIFGPNIGFSSTRVSSDTFFLTTVSKWNIKDEHGRRGLSLSQGILISEPREETAFPSWLCEPFLGMLRVHKLTYQTLAGWLQEISLDGNKNDARELLSKILEGGFFEFDKSGIELVEAWVNELREGWETGKRFRVYADFPWPEELGFCSLIALQFILPSIRTTAGGHLNSFERYDHIYTSENIPGFDFVDLNVDSNLTKRGLDAEVFAPIPAMEIPGDSGNKSADREKWKTLSLVGLAVLTTLLATIGWYFIHDYNSRLRLLVEAIDTLSKTRLQLANSSEVRPPDSARETPSSSQQLQLIERVFQNDSHIRAVALNELLQRSRHEPKVTLDALDYAEEHMSSKLGLYSTLLLLKSNPEMVKENSERVRAFISNARSSLGPQALALADQITQLL